MSSLGISDYASFQNGDQQAVPVYWAAIVPPDENLVVKESAALESKSKGYYFLLLVLGLAGLSGYFFSISKVQYGLDVNGGVRIEYKMKTEDLTAEQRANLPSLRSHMQNVLTNRVGSALGVVEGTVIPKGEDSFIIEIPGFTDAQKARDTLSTTASIELYHAKTVVTEGPLGQLRQFDIDEDKAEGGKPMVTFRQRTDATKVIKPGTPEYAAMIKTWDIIVKGDELSDAYPEAGGGSVIVGLTFSNAGSKKMEAWSRRYLNQGEMLASVLDGVVLNIAPLAPNAIIKDRGIIQGKFEAGYVKSLTDLLKAGSLPVGLTEQSVATVDPTIGKEALKAMQLAGVISFAVVALFLIVYYAFPGVVALFALLLYILFTLTAMKLIGATFSLAAIAGFILSIGVAVDANILVFERVKEEIRDGRSLLRAVDLGFRKALPSIIDSNSCTILTSLVLVNFGTGPVKGFATTLILGVFISLFTAITVTRSLLVFLVGSGIGANPKAFALGRSWFGEKFEREATTNPMKIMQKSRKWFLISLATIIPGMIFLGIGGLKANVEFLGGFRVSVLVPDGNTLTSNQILDNLEKGGFKGSNVSFSTTEGKRYASMTVPGGEASVANRGIETKIAETAGFKAADIKEQATVGAAVQKETVRNAILGIIFSSLGIMLYLGIRFGIALGGIKNGIKFGLAAIGAMLHDVLVVLGVAAIMGFFLGWEMSALFITAMLTVIGFSVHDTVVVFDRIRENLRRHNATDTFEHICNVSVSQSFARSINTSLTVIASLCILIGLGTPTVDLKFFCLAMLAGIISGTYSSIYNATPILYLWDKAIMKRKGEKAGMVAESESARIEIAQQQALLQQEMGLTQPAGKTGGTPPAGYSQVKRRDSVIEKSKRSIDLDDEDKDKD